MNTFVQRESNEHREAPQCRQPTPPHLDVVISHIKNLEVPQISDSRGKRLRQAVARQFQLDYLASARVVAFYAVPIAVVDTRVQPACAHRPFPPLGREVEFNQGAPFGHRGVGGVAASMASLMSSSNDPACRTRDDLDDPTVGAGGSIPKVPIP